MKMITCFLPFDARETNRALLSELQDHPLVGDIVYTGSDELPVRPFSLDGLRAISSRAPEGKILLITAPLGVTLGFMAIERFQQVMEDSSASWLYSDYIEEDGGERKAHPLIDYQEGSLRDDFDFGPLVMIDAKKMAGALSELEGDWEHAGLYALRLKLSQARLPVRIQENLYTAKVPDRRASGEKIFDYVDPKNREVQLEMEEVVSRHLREVGAYLEPDFLSIAFDADNFPVEASVIIPVLNRVKTIRDAVESALAQECDFEHNVIVVDNHSSDGTTRLLEELAAKDGRLVHVIPGRHDLGIGGCWNLGAHHPMCGKFAVQLDSDDLYSDTQSLARMIAAFYEQQCAMVVGSYRMCNFDLEEIPPGIIDHREWTADNGRNNALRINGLGAPRAFYTPVLRQINVPNVSYGEDYGLGLRISREYQIGRIYDPLYLCRRWEDNSDAALPLEVMNRHNSYKDRLRTYELQARQAMKGHSS